MPVPAQHHSEIRAQHRKLKLALPYREPHSWGELNVAGRFIARLGCDENCTRQTQAQTAHLTSQTEVCATRSPLLQRSTHCESQVPKRVNQTIGSPQRGNICLRLSASPASPPYPPISLASVGETALQIRLLPVPLSHPHRGHYPTSQAKACATAVTVARVSTRERDFRFLPDLQHPPHLQIPPAVRTKPPQRIERSRYRQEGRTTCRHRNIAN